MTAITTPTHINLAIPLSSQRWDEIGEHPPPIDAASDHLEITKQLASILALRLDVLLHSRNDKDQFPSDIILKLSSGSLPSLVTPTVYEELTEYVSDILSRYRNVPYHNKEHAAHVTISINKLIYLAIAADECLSRKCTTENNAHYQVRKSMRRQSSYPVRNESQPNDNAFTYNTGITNNALYQFALLFATLVHDVDHTGVPNRQLVKEADELALIYNDRSVAEQHSLTLAFTVLKGEKFSNFQNTLMPTQSERRKFRVAVIDLVLTTDIANPERMQINMSKWKEAFEAPFRGSRRTLDSQGESEMTPKMNQGRRHSIQAPPKDLMHTYRLGIKRVMLLGGKTIDFYSNSIEGENELKTSAIFERLIETADVAHTMQSWKTFVKWNKRLYSEQYKAYKAGRGVDPTLDWYENQFTFYDYYIIPLAKKLLQCGVFGENGSIFLHQAQQIRAQWEYEGISVCESLFKQYHDHDTEKRSGADINGLN